MRRDSMDRTGRVGDFQWRFFKGSFDSMIGCTRGNSPEGSVYSTVVPARERKLATTVDVKWSYRSHCLRPPVKGP